MAGFCWTPHPGLGVTQNSEHLPSLKAAHFLLSFRHYVVRGPEMTPYEGKSLICVSGTRDLFIF